MRGIEGNEVGYVCSETDVFSVGSDNGIIPSYYGKELKHGCNFFSKVITHLTELTGKFTDITLADIQFKQRVDNQFDSVDAYDSSLEQNCRRFHKICV